MKNCTLIKTVQWARCLLSPPYFSAEPPSPGNNARLGKSQRKEFYCPLLEKWSIIGTIMTQNTTGMCYRNYLLFSMSFVCNLR